MMNDIILLAMPEEAPSLVGKEGVFFTGVGKVNAAIVAATLIERYKPTRVFNFGTAGGITATHGGIYKCTTFNQRDVILGGVIVGPQAEILHQPIIIGDDGWSLSTGFSIAKACVSAGVEFICHKYISDMANDEAPDHFVDHVHKGEEHYIEILKEYGVQL